jgi:predicted nucleic acid-binding protein
VENAIKVASHDIAYVELRSALARLEREARLSPAERSEIRAEFENDWKALLVIETTYPLIRRAADFAERYALRADDSVHLAAADRISAASGVDVVFGCFDQRLNDAAQALGLTMLV